MKELKIKGTDSFIDYLKDELKKDHKELEGNIHVIKIKENILRNDNIIKEDFERW